MPDQLVYRRLACDELRLFEGNPRRGNVDLIAKSLAAHGQYRPIVVNVGTLTGRPLEVLAGNHTLRAARLLDWSEVDGDDDPDHEPLLYGFTGGGSGRLGRGGDRWYGGNNASTVFAFPKPPRNTDHPTMKPVALIDAMLANSLAPGGVVLDPFSGSGSTLIAAHGRQARAFCVELDPRYADVILRRFEAHTGVVPTLDGEPVSFVKAAA